MSRTTSPAAGSSGGSGRPAGRWWILGSLLLVVTLVILGRAFWAADEVAAPAPAEIGAPVAAGQVAAGEAGPGAGPADGGPDAVAPEAAAPGPAAPGAAGEPGVVPPAERSAPVSLRIPAIGVSVAVGELGLNQDGTVEVPTDFALPGWYRLGTAPGEVGSAVILGHVDSYRGPAVFYRLRSLTAGDEIEVTLADGVVARFAVTEVATYPKPAFPAEQVYGGGGGSALALVTCGGEFDRSARSYRSNVVAYAALVGTTPLAGGQPAAQN
jgi:hypothetical protein